MGYRYPVKPSSDDSHQTDYYWIAVVVPFAIKNTIARKENDQTNILNNYATLINISSDEANINPIAVNEMFIIDDDIIRWQTSCSKESHLSTLNMTLLPDDSGYINKIAPEDWIIFWAFDNYTAYKTVKDNLLSQPIKPCNDFDIAPKFMGRIDSIMMNKSVDPNSGRASLTYAVNCVGFVELDSSIYFDERLEALRADAALVFHDFSNAEAEITAAGIITTQEAIVGLLNIFLGTGPGEASKSFGQAGSVASPNQAFLIPKTIMEIIPRSSGSKGNAYYTYADLLKIIIGIQKYDEKGIQPFLPNYQSGDVRVILVENDTEYRRFEDSSTDVNKLSTKNGVYKTFHPVTGTFNQPILSFNNVPLWSTLKTFLLEPVNEMYTCLRSGADGRVGPTLVIRQIPLSTQEFVDQNNDISTSFWELPCWDIDSSLVSNIQVGRSNVLRYNFISITPSDLSKDPQVASDEGRFLANPVMDEADIRRAGVKGIILNQSFATAQNDQILHKDASFWNRVMADVLFGSHLKYSGTITTSGISAPICQGDNCAVDGVVYHIERIVHVGGIDPSGRKTFITNLQVSNGLTDNPNSKDNPYPGLDEKGEFKEIDPGFGINTEHE